MQNMFVCQCFGVTQKEIVTLARQGCKHIDDLAEETYAGQGCGDCVPALNKLLNNALSFETAKD